MQLNFVFGDRWWVIQAIAPQLDPAGFAAVS
ncbi:hypothetical protein SAMN05421740_103409 [Parapedobacter koreensis]|uniref:Uncharacterized protein n=1 Tax=Parapedobacter koreensis TaxID=332977 RepID=A0A1H7M8P5_9SPHI|nr:hypothetical protein SAMN05421740_103409 [Parapedobacter koreensis]